MTDAVLWSAFVALFCGALYFAWPRPPSWDPAVFHHLVLASLHRGELEARNATLDEWKARLAARLPVGPKPPSGGWTVDPELLGADYATTARLGAGVTWDVLAERGPPLAEAIGRRLADVRVVWFGPAPLQLPGVRSVQRPSVQLDTLDELLVSPSTRLVLATQTEGAALLAALKDAAGIRDRVRAVLFVGATFDPAWNAASLSQDAFDTELDRVTPWFVLRSSDAPEAVLLEPPLPATRRHSIAVLDLGLATPEALADAALAESLVVVLAALG